MSKQSIKTVSTKISTTRLLTKWSKISASKKMKSSLI
jgi:hypothetical protein